MELLSSGADWKMHRRPHGGPGLVWFLAVGLLLVLTALFAVTTALSPMYGEDYMLSAYMPWASLSERLAYVAGKSAAHIATWNARLGEQLAIFWLTMPRFWFVAANTLAFGLFSLLVAALARGSVRWTPALAVSAAWSACLTYLLWPKMEIFFWTTGAGNYFHTLLLTLLVLAPFLLEDLNRPRRFARWGLLALVPAAFLAGASFENVPPGMLVCMALCLAARHRRGETGLRGLGAVAAAYALGWAVLVLAPSTTVRTHLLRTEFGFPGYSVRYLLERASDTVLTFAGTSEDLLLVSAAAVAAALARGRIGVLRYGGLPALCLGAVVSAALVIAAPYTEPRAAEILWTALLIGLVRLAAGTAGAVALPERAGSLLLGTVGAVAVAMAAYILVAYADLRARVDARTEAIVGAIGTPRCEDGVELPALNFVIELRIMTEREHWARRWPVHMSKYFHCKVIVPSY